MSEKIRNIGFIGDTDELAYQLKWLHDNPPKGCPCEQSIANGNAVMCFMCEDVEASNRYQRYHEFKRNEKAKIRATTTNQ